MASILVADEDITLCTFLRNKLKEVGYNAEFRTNWVEVLKYLRKNHVEIILLDSNMSAINGFEVLKKLRYNIIVLTNHTDVKNLDEAVRIGIIDFIRKPFDFEKLLFSIRTALMRKGF